MTIWSLHYKTINVFKYNCNANAEENAVESKAKQSKTKELGKRYNKQHYKKYYTGLSIFLKNQKGK